MGFGLTISKRIVQMLNGDIRVVSAPNYGSTFTFEIGVDDENDSCLEDSNLDENHTKKAPIIRQDEF